MELTYSINVDCDRHGNPTTAYATVAQDDGQRGWLADIEFGPFDTWLDVVSWARRQMSLDMDARFT